MKHLLENMIKLGYEAKKRCRPMDCGILHHTGIGHWLHTACGYTLLARRVGPSRCGTQCKT